MPAVKQSKYELLKVLAMLTIVAHHLVSKNAFDVDTDILGITPNKLAFQILGNLAFVGNNLFFLVSAHFLFRKKPELSYSLNSIARIEKPVLFYGVTLGLATLCFGGGHCFFLFNHFCH